MPTVAELDRLKALVDRLLPLTNIQRGDVIKAQDWNDLAGSLIEVARAVLAQDTTTVVPPHEHPDQVKTSWLDPALRAIVERGPLGDPTAQASVLDLQRNVNRISTSIDTLSLNTKEVRDRVAVASTNDLVRQSEVATVRRTVEGLNDSREDVLALRTSLQSVQKDVQTAVSVAQRLTVNGQPVDMAVVDQRIKNVEQLADRLRTPSGDLLDAGKLENRLTELTNTLVTQKQLEEFLKAHPVTVSQDQLAAIETNLHAALKTDLDSATTSVGNDLRAEVAEQFGQVDGLVSRAVADALPGATQSALTIVRPEIAAAASKALSDAQDAITARLTDATASLRLEFKGQLDGLRDSTVSLVQAEVSGQTVAQLDPIRKNISDLQLGLAGATTRQTLQDATLQTIGTRLETIAREDASARADLRTSVLAEIDRRITQHAATMDSRLADASAQQQLRLDASITEIKRGLTDQITRTVTDTVAIEIRKAETRINANMVGVARDQVVAVQDQLQASVSAAVASAMQGMPGAVAQEVRRQTANLPDLVKSEFTAFQPALTQMVDRSVATRLAPQRNITGAERLTNP